MKASVENARTHRKVGKSSVWFTCDNGGSRVDGANKLLNWEFCDKRNLTFNAFAWNTHSSGVIVIFHMFAIDPISHYEFVAYFSFLFFRFPFSRTIQFYCFHNFSFCIAASFVLSHIHSSNIIKSLLHKVKAGAKVTKKSASDLHPIWL